jgi:hypothetical protein
VRKARREDDQHVKHLGQPSRTAALAAGVAAVAVAAGAFAAGRLTASDGQAPAPRLVAAHVGGAAVSLPHLSSAAPLPALAATPKPRVVTQPAPAAPAPVQLAPLPTPPKHANPKAKPVRIVGSG